MANMTPQQFDIIAGPDVLGLSGKAAEAARLAIVGGMNMREAATAVGLTGPAAVSRAVSRVRAAYDALEPLLR
ncbi:TrfB plasmid transcriptional repressor [Chromobacterium vaccinii]|nr:TrfB plasmid transcriptional repressor [Chromobacterium vaccinii]QND89827.1 TrfB plasmid transcriptional repressor [Chromobacterium vaccinii]